MKLRAFALAGVSALALSLTAVPLTAQERNWDSDGDGVITRDEFDAGWSEEGAFDAWDADEDGALSEDEFGDGAYSRYDQDDSGDWDVNDWELFDGDEDWL